MKEKNILVAFLAIIIAISLSMTVFAMDTNANAEKETTISEAYIPSENLVSMTNNAINKVIGIRESNPYLFGESGLTLFPEVKDDEEVMLTVSEEIVIETECNEITYEEIQESYEVVDDWLDKEDEYAAAAYIWKYMKNLGWSDAVCAGIMGNLMVEVGGQTLDIRYYLYDASGYYYGMCQWNAGAYGSVHGAGLEYQCDFLRDTIQHELDVYGYAYQSEMDFAGFLELSSASEVATAFAMCYERCDASTYGIRCSSAEVAYSYFVN